MNREQKQEFVNGLKERFTAQSILVVQYKGMKTFELEGLRKAFQSKGRLTVIKNTLARRALAGTNFQDLENLLTGQTAIIDSNDTIATAKILVEESKKLQNLVIVGGKTTLDGMVNPEQIKLLASLPSLEEARGTLVGLLQRPAQQLLSLKKAVLSKLPTLLTIKPQEEKFH